MGADSRTPSYADLSRRQWIAGAMGAAALPIASSALLVPSAAQARAVAQPVRPDDERFMRLAIAEAARGDYPFGAVIVRDGKVMAQRPQSRQATSAIRPRMARWSPSAASSRATGPTG